MKVPVLALVLFASVLAGCIGGEDAANRSARSEDENPNPWQSGLADHYPTPDFVEHRSADERRAELAPSGDPEFAAFDAEIEKWMAAHNVPAGQFALMKDGRLRYASGYGFTDRDETEPTDTDTLFRIASVTKPITAQLIALLVEEGRVSWEDRVFCVPPDPKPDCLLPIEPHPDRPVIDRRTANITVRHFADHAAGWTNGAPDPCNDPIYDERSTNVANALGAGLPLQRWRLAQWGLGAELVRDPGEGYAYCNGGYIALSLIAEAVTGADFEAVYDAYLFRPLGVSDDVGFGHALPEDRDPREPFYSCAQGERQSVFEPNETVCWPDGAFSIQMLSGAGGLVATAEAMVAVYEAYREHAHVWESGDGFAWHFAGGAMPGTSSFVMSLADGQDSAGDLQYAVVFNKDKEGPHCDSAPDPPEDAGTEFPACNRDQLVQSLARVATAWGIADETAR